MSIFHSTTEMATNMSIRLSMSMQGMREIRVAALAMGIFGLTRRRFLLSLHLVASGFPIIPPVLNCGIAAAVNTRLASAPFAMNLPIAWACPISTRLQVSQAIRSLTNGT